MRWWWLALGLGGWAGCVAYLAWELHRAPALPDQRPGPDDPWWAHVAAEIRALPELPEESRHRP